MFMFCFEIKLHVASSGGSLVTAIKQKVIYIFHAASFCFLTVYKKKKKVRCTFSIILHLTLNNVRAEYEVALLSAPRSKFVTLYRVSQEERSVFWEVSSTIDH
jgi:hypothetical protein